MKTTLKPKLIVMNDTEFYDLGDCADSIKRIENVYLADYSRQADSYWCEHLYTCIEFEDHVSQADQETLYEAYGHEDCDGCYIPASHEHGVVHLDHEDFELDDGFTYDDALDDVVEYYRCNWRYG